MSDTVVDIESELRSGIAALKVITDRLPDGWWLEYRPVQDAIDLYSYYDGYGDKPAATYGLLHHQLDINGVWSLTLAELDSLHQLAHWLERLPTNGETA